MFKKPVKIGAQNQLSGKDRKTMKNKLVALFNEQCVEKILAINDKIISCKVSGSKMLIFNGNEYPVFVDGTSKGDFFPSLYSVQAFEPLAKCLDINEGVESFIFNGANLMWPGVRSCSELGEFKKDEVIGIRSAKGEPIAVGAMGCSFKQYQQKSDSNGVAVYILHYKGDKLWEMGPKTNPQVIIASEKPKEKVQQKVEQMKEEQSAPKKDDKKKKKGKKDQEADEEKEVKEVKEEPKKAKKEKTPQKKQASSESEHNSSGGDDDEDGFMNMVHAGKKGGAKKEIKVEKKKPAVFSDEQDDHKKGKKKGGKKDQKKKGKGNKNLQQESEQEEKKPAPKKGKKKQQDSDEESNEGEQKTEEPVKSVISAKLMDQYLKECFLNAIKLSRVESQLPIDSGRFYMDFMLLARPEGVKLEVKDSSYKKLGKFYEQMSKQKFIEFKHSKDKKGQQGATINKIFWENKELSNYEPTILRIGEKEVEAKQQMVTGKKKLVINRNLIVENTYKPSKDLMHELFRKTVNFMPTEQQEEAMKKEAEQAKNRPTHFPENEMKAIIEKYINQIAQGKSKKEKTEKMVIINYKANPFLEQLLKKQIQYFEENQEDEEQDEEDEEEDKKKKGKKKGGVKVFRIDRNTLLSKILKKCSPSYHLLDKENDKDIFAEGTFKGVQLVAQKSNNKNITKIIGLETFILPKSEADEQMNGLANQLQQKFACSVNIQNLPGKNAGKEIIVHGHFITELQQMLVGEYGLREQFISSQNKLDKKKKK